MTRIKIKRKKGAAKGKGGSKTAQGKGKTIKSSGNLKEGSVGESQFDEGAIERRIQNLKPKAGVNQKKNMVRYYQYQMH